MLDFLRALQLTFATGALFGTLESFRAVVGYGELAGAEGAFRD